MRLGGRGDSRPLRPRSASFGAIVDRGVEIVIGVGVGPMKAFGRKSHDRAHEFKIVGGRLRIADLDIEILVAKRLALPQLVFGTGDRRRLNGPA